jgi:O-antigen ligase
MLAVGLLCSLTRSAWLGTVLSLLLLSIVMGQMKRFALHASLGLALFAVSIPLLGLGDYLFATKTGEDLSEKGHRDSVFSGLQYVAEHPLGGGNEKIGPRRAEENSNAFLVENTYLAFATEYGIIGLFCFLGFIFCAVLLVWRQQSPLGYGSLGILFGVGLVMLVFNLHDDRRLACWEWFPIGLAVRAAIADRFNNLALRTSPWG